MFVRSYAWETANKTVAYALSWLQNSVICVSVWLQWYIQFITKFWLMGVYVCVCVCVCVCACVRAYVRTYVLSFGGWHLFEDTVDYVVLAYWLELPLYCCLLATDLSTDYISLWTAVSAVVEITILKVIQFGALYMTLAFQCEMLQSSQRIVKWFSSWENTTTWYAFENFSFLFIGLHSRITPLTLIVTLAWIFSYMKSFPYIISRCIVLYFI